MIDVAADAWPTPCWPGRRSGIGDKLLAIPWSALTLDTDRKMLPAGYRSGTLAQCRRVRQGKLAAHGGSRLVAEIHEYYGQPPHQS